MNLRRSIKLLALGILLATIACASLQASQTDETAQKAYELRMDGKADEAKALLEKALSDDPGNAAAHYELARTHLYLATGNPPQLEEQLRSAQSAIEKAVELEPDSAVYALLQGHVAFFHAYMSLKSGGEGAKEKFAKVCSAFERAARNKPGNSTPMLYLVEIYGSLPEEMGGDKAKAEKCAEKLDGLDAVCAAKARSILLPEDTDRIAYWKQVLEKHAGNAAVLEELGKACFCDEKFDEGVRYIEKAIKADPARKYLILDLARVHLFRVMRGLGDKEASLNASSSAAARYLETNPLPPLKAYTLGIMSKIKRGMGDEDGSAKMREEAARIDPNFSKASAIPRAELFMPPGKLPADHRYLLRPF